MMYEKYQLQVFAVIGSLGFSHVITFHTFAKAIASPPERILLHFFSHFFPGVMEGPLSVLGFFTLLYVPVLYWQDAGIRTLDAATVRYTAMSYTYP